MSYAGESMKTVAAPREREPVADRIHNQLSQIGGYLDDIENNGRYLRDVLVGCVPDQPQTEEKGQDSPDGRLHDWSFRLARVMERLSYVVEMQVQVRREIE